VSKNTFLLELQMSISIRSLNKRYPSGNHALKDINMEIPTGMFGLLGPNGAGKSTLMRILVALMEPTSGEVNIFGYDLMKQRKEIRNILGYLPQDFRFFAKYKTYEFLDYAARLSGMNNGSKRRQAVDTMLESVGLFDVRERYANKLSGGMKRRLGIAQALIHNPKLIIVDEPTTGLDPEERIRFRNLLAEISERNVTIILSTHIVGDISSSCNCMALMNKGEVAFFGSPQEMLKESEGKVWKMKVSGDELPLIDKKYPVISTIPSGTGWEVQVVADEVVGYNAESYPPNLEHAYVYYMEQRLNRWVND
jgi:ABC-type multidrug transport system ATPase subunit